MKKAAAITGISILLATGLCLSAKPAVHNSLSANDRDSLFLTGTDSLQAVKDTVYFDPLFLPVVFDGKLLPDSLSLIPQSPQPAQYHLLQPEETFQSRIERMQFVRDIQQDYYRNNIDSIDFDLEVLQSIPKDTIKEEQNLITILSDLIKPDTTEMKFAPAAVPRFITPVWSWYKSGDHSLLLAQNNYSENWYKGGNNNFNFQNYHKILLNYKKKKFSFNNTIEWKLNVQSTPADTVHAASISEDFLRFYSVLGIDAYKKWSYSANIETKTPLFNSYPINSDIRQSAFLSPLEVNSGIGMSYALNYVSSTNKYKNLKLTLNIAPLSVNYKYVEDTEVDETKSGIKEGEKSITKFGSTLTTDLTYNHNRYIGFTSRLKLFSNYESFLAESENRFTMALNRYLSTVLYFYLRFDDTVPIDKKDKNWGYFQYNETLSFGLNFKW